MLTIYNHFHNILRLFLTFWSETMRDYHIYSSERPGRSSNFEFSKEGAYSREALFRGRRSFNILKRHQNTFNLSL